MKKSMNKRWIIFSSLVLVMVMATAGMAVSGVKGQFGFFGSKGGMHKERVLSKLDYSMQELKLTPEQQAKYTVIRSRMAQSMDDAQAHREKVRENVRAEMNQEQPDVRALAKTMKKEARSMPDMLTAQIDSVLEIYDILHKDQQAKFVQMVKERMERMNHRRGPKGLMDKDLS